MISNILYEGKLKEQQSDYFYSDEYVDFLITKYLFTKRQARVEDVYEYITKYIDPDLVKMSGLKRFLKGNYENIKTMFYLNQSQKENITNTLDMKKDLDFIMFASERKLCLKISEQISNGNFNFDKTLLNVLMLDYKYNKNNNNKDYYLSLIYYIKNNYQNLISKVKDSIESIDNFYNELELSEVISNDNIIKILSLNNTIIIDDLAKYLPEKLLSIFSIDLSELFNLVSSIGENYERVFQDAVYTFYSQLSEHAVLVFKNRFNYYSNEPQLTLEQIGNKLGVTRERIRQIEAKTIDKLLLQMPTIKNILKCIYIKLADKDEQFIDVDRLYIYLKELSKKNSNDHNAEKISIRETAGILLFFMEMGDSNIKYNRNLRVIYNSDMINVDEIINHVVERFGNTLSPKEIRKMNSFELKVLNSEYREFKNGIYLKRGISPREIYSEIIEKNFKGGYRTGSQEDYDIFKKRCIEKYGIIEELPSMHSLQGMLERSDYVLIDKGKYLPSELCPSMDNELIDDIINYIVDNEPTVFYRSIFEKYKYKLQKLGIDNHYFLKGCLDKYLPEEFTTKRDYIMVGDVKMSPAELIISYMQAFEKEFELRDLQDKFPGVKDYVFYNHLYNETNNGLIWTSSKTFIYYKYLNISDDTVYELRKFIDEQFESMKTDVISSRKIYAKMSLTNKELLEKLHLTHGQFTLFSLMKYLYPDLYYSRPLVSTKVMEQKSSYALIKNHAQKFDKFDHNTILDYVDKMNIGGLYSYLEFMDDMSDEYVQINIDTMVRKEKLGITQEQLTQLNQLLDLIFDKYNELDTSVFKGYQMLPKMSVQWNKYLLIGIIRSYFDEQFVIENKNNMYNNTDFVIRRLNHE